MISISKLPTNVNNVLNFGRDMHVSLGHKNARNSMTNGCLQQNLKPKVRFELNNLLYASFYQSESRGEGAGRGQGGGSETWQSVPLNKLRYRPATAPRMSTWWTFLPVDI